MAKAQKVTLKPWRASSLKMQLFCLPTGSKFVVGTPMVKAETRSGVALAEGRALVRYIMNKNVRRFDAHTWNSTCSRDMRDVVGGLPWCTHAFHGSATGMLYRLLNPALRITAETLPPDGAVYGAALREMRGE